jgi:hypothetical protein
MSVGRGMVERSGNQVLILESVSSCSVEIDSYVSLRVKKRSYSSVHYMRALVQLYIILYRKYQYGSFIRMYVRCAMDYVKEDNSPV